MTTVPLKITLEEHAVGAPEYQSEHAAGMDLVAAIDREIEIAPGEVVAVPTGLRLEIPVGYEGQVRPRSGLAAKHAIGVPNAPGTIDADYRGEVKVLLVNLGRSPYRVQRGDRIAQLVIAPVVRAAIDVVASLTTTARGDGGFGHTGR
ncbi:MAG TPA: dUTP diphosphatase [Candidatus Eisenbacteria bacterium]|nr:dUTP diphosphatase [Candidatus Eisenbacteria bacterium]